MKVTEIWELFLGVCEYHFGIFPKTSCHPNYFKCAANIPVETACDVGLTYDPRIHACNYPDQMLELGCDPEALLGGFRQVDHP